MFILMSCTTSTSPINISKSLVKNICDKKCAFSYKYSNSTCNVTNNAYYISIPYDENSSPEVEYNNMKIKATNIQIFQPSLNKYEGKQLDGEILIYHTGTDTSVILCIPIVKSSLKTEGSQLLETLFSNTATRTPNTDDAATINFSNFNINSLIPKGSFYTYEATLPIPPCNGKHNFIVFSGFVSIDTKTYENMITTIGPHSFETKNGPQLFLNPKGAFYGTRTQDMEDDIYIECNPVGEDGEILYSKNKSLNLSLPSEFNISDIMKSPYILFILSIMGLTIVYKGSQVAWNIFNKKKLNNK